MSQAISEPGESGKLRFVVHESVAEFADAGDEITIIGSTSSGRSLCWIPRVPAQGSRPLLHERFEPPGHTLGVIKFVIEIRLERSSEVRQLWRTV